jgi:hypothetical protein
MLAGRTFIAAQKIISNNAKSFQRVDSIAPRQRRPIVLDEKLL